MKLCGNSHSGSFKDLGMTVLVSSHLLSEVELLKGRDLGFARRSFAIASAFGMASILSVIRY